MAIEGYFHPYFGHVNQNRSFPDSNSNVYATVNYNNVELETFHQQKDEVDHFLRSQNEKLRIFVQEQRKQQVETLLKKIELDVFSMLKQKDEQIAQATKRRLELEELLARLEIENQTWQRAAHENEAMVLSLQNALEQQMKERASYCYNNDDAESCCDNKNHQEETGENRVCGDEQITSVNNMMICKCCRSRESSFMFLPCRHLCSCKACEPSLQACPVCLMQKRSIIETLIF
ncbi:E3 ubiquitin-protein ligase BOI-like [Trifolium pratense]|uniref:E3 ubiquitin-protein ligase BOI-like n=1 Tax=Trifolium pratense TaxID=57577 RepID=UPI001E695F82|nr:E3 ubiquitin-protein ligase BOI-like [Trifolium pratense]